VPEVIHSVSLHSARLLSPEEDRVLAIEESLTSLRAGKVSSIFRDLRRTEVALENGAEISLEQASFGQPRATISYRGDTSELERSQIARLKAAIHSALERILTD
jgi:hypothetical protein